MEVDRNQPPELDSGFYTFGLVNEYFEYFAKASDPDGDSVSVKFKNLPDWLICDNSSIYGLPVSAGNWNVGITIDDNQGSRVDDELKISINSKTVMSNSIKNSINIDTMMATVKLFAGETFYKLGTVSGYINSRNRLGYGNIMAANWLKYKLGSFGLATGEQDFSKTGTNIIAFQTGVDYADSLWIISAHFDVWNSGRISPGADDNASGVAAVLEIARILSKYISKYSIAYAFWDESENGNLGSMAYAQQLTDCGENVAGIIEIDMIGSDFRNDETFLAYKSGSGFRKVEELVLELSSEMENPLIPVFTDYVFESDMPQFWSHGYPGIGITKNYTEDDHMDVNRRYIHTIDDKSDLIEEEYYLSLTRLVASTFSQLAGALAKEPDDLNLNRINNAGGCLTMPEN